MKILGEFREFISRGNVIDLAVGVIIGAAFNKIVSALVDDVVMPVVGLLTAGVDFAELKVVLKQAGATAKQPEVAIHYGAFINALVQFLLIALTVFFMVKAVNMLRRFSARQEEAEAAAEVPPAPTATEVLLMEIRDELKAKAPRPPQAPRPQPQKRRTAAKSS